MANPVYFVTGHAGFIGSRLVSKLLERGERVEGCEKGDTISIPEMAHVIHLGAMGSVPACEDDRAMAFYLNVTRLGQLLDCCAHSRVSSFVFASSSSVYGTAPNGDVTYRNPISWYGTTKAAGELLVSAYAPKFPVAYTRLFNVYGPGQRNLALVPQVCRALLGMQELSLYGSVHAIRRQFVYVDDVCDVLSAIGPTLVNASRHCHAFNVAGPEQVTVLEVVKMLQDLADAPVSCRFESPRAGDIPESRCDADSALTLLKFLGAGWKARKFVPLSVGLKHTWQWWKEQQANGNS